MPISEQLNKQFIFIPFNKKILKMKKMKQNDKEFDSRNYSVHLPIEHAQKRDYITSFQQYMIERKRRQQEDKEILIQNQLNTSNSPNKIVIDRSEIDKETNLNVQGNLIRLRLPQIPQIKQNQQRRPALRDPKKQDLGERKIRKYSQYSRPIIPTESHRSQEIQVKKKQMRDYGNYFDMNIIINWANKLYLEKSGGPFKAYVGAGNNQQLVKYILKQRSQWQLAMSKDEEGISLIWTQTKKQKFFNKIEYQQESNSNGREIKCGSVKFLSQNQQQIIDRIWRKYEKIEINKMNNVNGSHLKIDEIKVPFQLVSISQPIFIHNHIFNGEQLGDKKVAVS